MLVRLTTPDQGHLDSSLFPMLESRVTSLEANVGLLRELYVVRFIFRLNMLIPSQPCKSERTVAGMRSGETAPRAIPVGYLTTKQVLQGRVDDQSDTLRQTKERNTELWVRCWQGFVG